MTPRYGVAELMLVQPGVMTYAAAPAPDAPHVQHALAWAAGDGMPGEPFGDVSSRAARERLTIFGHAQHPERLTAPPPLAVELALAGGELLIAAAAGRPRGWRGHLLRFPPAALASLGLGVLRRRAERASARRLGVSATTAPHARYGFQLVLVFLVATVLRRARRGERPPARAWTLEAATRVIARFSRRRSWKRAYAAALNASQD